MLNIITFDAFNKVLTLKGQKQSLVISTEIDITIPSHNFKCGEVLIKRILLISLFFPCCIV